MTTVENNLRVTEAAEIIGVSVDTYTPRWEKKGLVKATRDSRNCRLFSIDELERVKNKYNGILQIESFVLYLKKRGLNSRQLSFLQELVGLALGYPVQVYVQRLLSKLIKMLVLPLNSIKKSTIFHGEKLLMMILEILKISQNIKAKLML